MSTADQNATFAKRTRSKDEDCAVEWEAPFDALVEGATFTTAELIAHGLLVISAAAGLVPLHPTRVAALRGLKDVTFKRPVTLGAAIRVRGSITGLRPVSPEAGLVTFAWVVECDGRTATRASVDVLWTREA